MSQRHRVANYGYAANGERRAEGVIAPILRQVPPAAVTLTAVTKAVKTTLTMATGVNGIGRFIPSMRVKILGTALTQLDFATAGLVLVESINPTAGTMVVRADTSVNGTTPTLGNVQPQQA